MSGEQGPVNAIVAALLNPATYPFPVKQIRHIETHISHLFLTGERAFKLKKPVYLGFLDYRSIEARRRACEREIARNGRYAPNMYLGTRSLIPTADGIRLGGADEDGAIEWLVEMVQFDESNLFSHLLQRGALSPDIIRDTAQVIYTFHRAAELRPGMWSESILRRRFQENFTALTTHGFRDVALSELEAKTRERIDLLSPLIDTRSRTSVRLLHGDLHLNNIVLIDGTPTLFDGIEFNDEYCAIDPWTDVAFLAMDLEAHGATHLANVLVNSYLEASSDTAGFPLFHLYIAYEATVRAKIAAIGLKQPPAFTSGATPEGESSSRVGSKTASLYLRVAEEALRRRASTVYAVGGISGSGKSTMARALAESRGAIQLRSDTLRKSLAEVAPTEALPPGHYSLENRIRVYRSLISAAESILDGGRDIIFDATFLEPDSRLLVEQLATRRGLRFVGIWCEISRELAKERILARRRDASDATAALVDTQMEGLVTPSNWRKLDTSQAPHSLIGTIV